MPATKFMLYGYGLLHRFASLFGQGVARPVLSPMSSPRRCDVLFLRTFRSVQSSSGVERDSGSANLMEVRGLTKKQAEELLDRLEVAGLEVCEVSQVSQEGFTVRYRERVSLPDISS